MALCIPVCASDWEAEDDAINDDESFSTGARGQVGGSGRLGEGASAAGPSL